MQRERKEVRCSNGMIIKKMNRRILALPTVLDRIDERFVLGPYCQSMHAALVKDCM